MYNRYTFFYVPWGLLWSSKGLTHTCIIMFYTKREVPFIQNYQHLSLSELKIKQKKYDFTTNNTCSCGVRLFDQIQWWCVNGYSWRTLFIGNRRAAGREHKMYHNVFGIILLCGLLGRLDIIMFQHSENKPIQFKHNIFIRFFLMFLNLKIWKIFGIKCIHLEKDI